MKIYLPLPCILYKSLLNHLLFLEVTVVGHVGPLVDFEWGFSFEFFEED